MAKDNSLIEAASIPVDSKKLALVVGVNNSVISTYPPYLKYAEHDAYEMAWILQQPACNFTLIEPALRGKEADTMSIRRAVIKLARERTDQDFLLFYFSGHAQPMKTKGDRTDVYFVTHDFKEDDVKVDPTMHLSMRWLWEVFYQQSSAGRALLILDCCYAGNMVDAGSDPFQIDLRSLLEEWYIGSGRREQKDRQRLILMSTGFDTPAMEKDGHGLMTGLLLPALRGEVEEVLDSNGHIDIHSLYNYLLNNMGEQPPNLSGEFGPNKWILASHPNPPVRLHKETGENKRKNEVEANILAGLFDKLYAETHRAQPFDHSICERASLTDLDLEKVSEFFKQARTQKQENFRPGISNQDQLVQFGFLQKAHPTYGTLLCFGQNPANWISGAFTRCIDWDSNDRFGGWREDQVYRGGLMKQFESSRDFLRKRLRLSRVIGREGRAEQWEIPFAALEEALANALVHREYAYQKDFAHRTEFVQVEVFNDRIEISSPGEPPAPMTLDLLGVENKSHPRNPQIAGIFYLYGYIEEVGSGIQRMQHLMAEAGLEAPEYKLSPAKTFSVILHRPKQVPKEVFQAEESDTSSTPVEVPVPIWTIPYSRNPLFTGRDDVLKRLAASLRTSKTTALTQSLAISGLGGIGKTQTAVEYAYRYRDNYSAVLWANANSRENLVLDFVAMARLLNLPEQSVQDQNIVVTAVKRWLQEHSDWLLILDNADDLSMVRDFLPSSGTGHILLTTRAQATGRLAQRIELDRMELEEGVLFLLHRAGILSPEDSLDKAFTLDHARAKEIVQSMDALPLALDQAGAYIEETGCSLADYLQLYHLRRPQLLERRGGLALDHPNAVASTWALSFEKVEQANPAAADLLRFCAFLSPDAIPEEIITEGAPNLGLYLQSVAGDRLTLDAAIKELLSYSLIRRSPESRTLIIHPLVQAVLRDSMDRDMAHMWAERAVLAVNRAFPDVEYATWPRCQRYLPQALACADLIGQWEMTFPEAARLLNQAGYYLRERAHYSEAEALLQRALAIREEILEPEDPSVAVTLNDLAGLYYAQGRYPESESLYQKALAIEEETLGLEHPSVAHSLNNLARLYQVQGKYALAESLLQQALAVNEKNLGPEHPATASSLNNLAGLYQVQGKYALAESLLQRALAVNEKNLGPEHPATASSLNNLALLYTHQGKYIKAEQLFQQALAVEEKRLGSEHPAIATYLNNLALLYSNQGNFNRSKTLLQRALAIRENTLGPEHPDMATNLNFLAIVYDAQGKYTQAELFCKRALDIREHAFGLEHPEVAQSLNTLAEIYRKRDKYNQAEPLYQQALAIYEKTLGPEYLGVAEILENYAVLLRKTNRKTEAAKLEAKAKAIRTKHDRENPIANRMEYEVE